MHLVDKVKFYCESQPDAIALVYKQQSLSYGNLKLAVENRAAFLQQKAIQHQFIGVCIEDPIDHLVALLAIVFSGNYYLSITKENEFLLSTEGIQLPSIWMADKPTNALKGEVFLLSEVDANQANYSTYPLAISNSLCSFYTSGSTGKPKLVVHTLETISKDTQRQVLTGDLTSTDCFDFIFSFSFSASLACIFTAFSCGAKLAIYPLKELGLLGLPEFWLNQNVTHSSLSVSTFRALATLEFPFKSLTPLKVLCVSGEAHLEKDVDLFFHLFPATCQLEIAYATTETRTITRQLINSTNRDVVVSTALGKAVKDKLVSIKDAQGKELAPLQSGEICVHSLFMAKEYKGDALQTAHAFGFEAGLPLYRTGDIGYLDEQGNLFYQGRLVQEEKLNGIKINLFLLEKCIEALPSITRAFAFIVSINEQSKLMLAYTGSTSANTADINSQLAANFPSNHLPAFSAYLANIPSTHTGKPDKVKVKEIVTSLYALSIANPAIQVEVDTELLMVLKQIWAEVLKVDVSAIQSTQQFNRDLGGDSMAALICIGKIEAHLKISLAYKEFIEAGNLRELVVCIEEKLASTQKSFFSIKKIDGQPYQKEVILFVNVFEGDEYQNYFHSFLKDNYQIYELNVHFFHEQFNFETLLESLAEPLKELKVKHVFGYSFSGFLAYAISCTYQEIATVIMLDTPNYFEPDLPSNRTNRLKTILNKSIAHNDFVFPVKYAFNWLKNVLHHQLGIQVVKSTQPSAATLMYYERIQQLVAKFNPCISPATCFYFGAARDITVWQTKSKGWQKYFGGDTKALLLDAFHGELGSNRNQKKILYYLEKHLN